MNNIIPQVGKTYQMGNGDMGNGYETKAIKVIRICSVRFKKKAVDGICYENKNKLHGDEVYAMTLSQFNRQVLYVHRAAIINKFFSLFS